MESEERFQRELMGITAVVRIIDGAGEVALGKGSQAIIYQAGKDLGREKGGFAQKTSDLEEAISNLFDGGEKFLNFEQWDEECSAPLIDPVVGGSRFLVIRRCPLLTLSRSIGSKTGGILCHAFHGYIAGAVEVIFSKKADLRISHCGPAACKVYLEMKS